MSEPAGIRRRQNRQRQQAAAAPTCTASSMKKRRLSAYSGSEPLNTYTTRVRPRAVGRCAGRRPPAASAAPLGWQSRCEGSRITVNKHPHAASASSAQGSQAGIVAACCPKSGVRRAAGAMAVKGRSEGLPDRPKGSSHFKARRQRQPHARTRSVLQFALKCLQATINTSNARCCNHKMQFNS